MMSGRAKGQSSELRGGRACFQSACWSIHFKVDLVDTDKVGLDLPGNKNNKCTGVGKSKVAWRIIEMGSMIQLERSVGTNI